MCLIFPSITSTVSHYVFSIVFIYLVIFSSKTLIEEKAKYFLTYSLYSIVDKIDENDIN